MHEEVMASMKDSLGRERAAGLWRCGRVLLLAWAACGFGGPATDGAELPGCQVVVNAAVEGSAVPRDLLADIFLKKVNRWGSGGPIVAVDQSLSSDVRRQFMRDVLRQSAQEVLNYWLRQINKGTRPPSVMESDVDVLEYVAATPGAIGYVSGNAAVDGNQIKILRIAD
jgi:ABC-type phosphate transport system substrate-binding protein